MKIFGGGPDDFIMTSCVYKNEEDSLISIYGLIFLCMMPTEEIRRKKTNTDSINYNKEI